MPERDTSTKAVEKASQTLLSTLVKVDKRMPLGPGIEQLSNAEAQRKLEHMSISERRELIDLLGDDKFLDLLQRVYKRG